MAGGITIQNPSGAIQQVPNPTNVATVTQVSTPPGGGSGFSTEWGLITGNILHQLDLQEQFALKAGLAELTAHVEDLNNPHQTTKAQVGLSNVDNLSRAEILDSPTITGTAIFTGPVTGITKATVGLGNVENLSPANMPVSLATQNALDLKSDLLTTVTKNSSTGAGNLPVGTTAQRPAVGSGKLRFNTDLSRFEGSSATAWGSLGGATGGGNDDAFYENTTTITASYTITTGKNAMSTGPISALPGAIVTVPPGSVWTVI